MKRISIFLFFALISLIPVISKAQISFSINIGNPPAWAPREYAQHTRYYYIPEIDSYYDASRGGYYINEGPNWVFSAGLPDYYGSVDISSFHRYPVSGYNGDRPYVFYNRNRMNYVRTFHPGWGNHGWYRPQGEVGSRGWDHRGGWDHGGHFNNGGPGRGPGGSGRGQGGPGRGPGEDHGNHGGDHGNHGGDRGGDHGNHGDHGGDHGGDRRDR